MSDPGPAVPRRRPRIFMDMAKPYVTDFPGVQGQLRTGYQGRNGMPEPVFYRRSSRAAERDAEVAAFVAAAKRRAAALAEQDAEAS